MKRLRSMVYTIHTKKIKLMTFMYENVNGFIEATYAEAVLSSTFPLIANTYL